MKVILCESCDTAVKKIEKFYLEQSCINISQRTQKHFLLSVVTLFFDAKHKGLHENQLFRHIMELHLHFFNKSNQELYPKVLRIDCILFLEETILGHHPPNKKFSYLTNLL